MPGGFVYPRADTLDPALHRVHVLDHEKAKAEHPWRAGWILSCIRRKGRAGISRPFLYCSVFTVLYKPAATAAVCEDKFRLSRAEALGHRVINPAAGLAEFRAAPSIALPGIAERASGYLHVVFAAGSRHAAGVLICLEAHFQEGPAPQPLHCRFPSSSPSDPIICSDMIYAVHFCKQLRPARSARSAFIRIFSMGRSFGPPRKGIRPTGGAFYSP